MDYSTLKESDLDRAMREGSQTVAELIGGHYGANAANVVAQALRAAYRQGVRSRFARYLRWILLAAWVGIPLFWATAQQAETTFGVGMEAVRWALLELPFVIALHYFLVDLAIRRSCALPDQTILRHNFGDAHLIAMDLLSRGELSRVQ